jgi:predicted metal-dependent hydrolase
MEFSGYIVQIERKKVKRLTLRLLAQQKILRCTAPLRVPLYTIHAFIESNREWANKQIAKAEKIRQNMPQIPPGKVLFLGMQYMVQQQDQYTIQGHTDHQEKIIYTSLNLLQENDLKKWYALQARHVIIPLVEQYAAKYGFEYGRIALRFQKSKWGSCSRKKNLNFNSMLMKMPLFVIEYLIIHELVHTVHFNHSREFWQDVQKYCPDYKKAEEYLHTTGRFLNV